MNKNIYWLIGLAIVVSACAKEAPEPDSKPDSVCENIPATCPEVDLKKDDECKIGEVGENFVTVNLKPNPMIVAPPNKCIKTKNYGYEVTFKITPASVEESTVWICPKEPADTWLEGTNSPVNTEIVITVPKMQYPTEGEKHDYTVVTTDGKCLDPRVDVF